MKVSLFCLLGFVGPDLCICVFCYRGNMKIRSLPILLLSILPGGFAFAQETPQTIADAELPSLLAITKTSTPIRNYQDMKNARRRSWRRNCALWVAT